MSSTTRDQILQRLHEWGVRRVFGYPGDGINGLMGAFDCIGEKMEFVHVAHEYVQTAMVPAQIRHLVDRAMRIARDQRTVTCLIIPCNVARRRVARYLWKHLPGDEDEHEPPSEPLSHGQSPARTIGPAPAAAD